jgi:eukaryotic-like serine/threonine-protein kinase
MQAATPGKDPFIGTTVPSELRTGVVYRVERRLGEGGTAIAYFASRFGPEGTSPAVLKIIQPAIIAQAGERAEMIVRKEAVALGRINERVPSCSSVVRLLDVGTTEYNARGYSLRLPWLALEYVHGGPEGTTLEDRVSRAVRDTSYAFPPERALRLIEQVTDGLTEIHAAGVIHRDLNPNNVLCCGSANAEMFKISDFGIARPVGMNATFGSETVGTPGYVAPEQIVDGVSAGFPVDIFGLGALLFHVLTGEELFQVSGLLAMVAARNADRRSILSTKGLCPEIRMDRGVCDGIDRALALATSPDPADRPTTPRAFAASLKSWLTSCPPTRRTQVPVDLVPGPSLPRWSFNVRHPAEPRWLIVRIGWDSDGHCLAATTDGLIYFDGTAWSEVPAHTLSGIRPIRFVSSAGAGRFLIGGDSAVIAEYSRSGVSRTLRGTDPALSFTDAAGDIGDLAAAIALRSGSPPLLVGVSGGRFLKPLPVTQAASLMGVSRLDETRFLVVGRGVDGAGLAGVYSPLEWSFELLPRTAGRALTSVASRPERELSLAAGAQGAILRRHHETTEVSYLPEGTDLASSALDVLGCAWTGGAGALWVSPSPESGWHRVWGNAEWRAPFVSIFAEPGFVMAAAADGAIIEGRVAEQRTSGIPHTGSG